MLNRHVIRTALLLLPLCHLFAWPAGIEVDPANGSLTVGELSAAMQIFNPEWRITHQRKHLDAPDPNYPKTGERSYEYRGVYPTDGGGSFHFSETVTQTAPDAIAAEFKLAARKEPVSCKLIALVINLPLEQFAAKNLKINRKPVRLERSRTFRKVREVELIHQGRRLVFSGDFSVALADQRPYKMQSFALRFLFSPQSGNVRESSLKLRITSSAFGMSPLAPAPGAAPGIRRGTEAVAALKRVGHPGGNWSCGGIRFELPSQTHPGRAVLQIGDGGEVRLSVPPDSGRQLYLLHRAEPGARPRIEAFCADGSVQSIEPASGRDFGFDNPPVRLANAAVAAAGKERTPLYLSMFDLSGEPTQIKLANTGSSSWLVAGITVSRNRVTVDKLPSVTFFEVDRNWAPLAPWLPARPGSVLDFSGWNDVPAGKYGRITTDADGHFITSGPPHRRIRFFGANLCFSAHTLTNADAEKLAYELASLGYNAVRFHHFDNQVAIDAGHLDPRQIDRLDYLFFCMKQRGIYVTIDIYCSRKLRPHELPDAPLREGFALKALTPVSAAARDNWKSFARQLLTHVNPYTGLSWGEDPALFGVSLLNESIAFVNMNGEKLNLYLGKYREYLEQNQLPVPERLRPEGESFTRFIIAAEKAKTAELSSFLRNELGYRGLITEYNYGVAPLLAELRDNLAWVDMHTYWDHPKFTPGRRWSLPYLHHQKSAMLSALGAPLTIARTRMFGKPFTVSEINYVYPNAYRAESGPLLGAVAGLQDWDGVFRFAWAHSDDTVRHERGPERFNIANDPLSQLAERVTGLLWRRGAVAPAPGLLAWPYSDDDFKGVKDFSSYKIPAEFERLALFCRIGRLPAGGSFDGARPLNPADFPDKMPAIDQFLKSTAETSETGEIVRNRAGKSLKVVTPTVESLAFHLGALTGDRLRVFDGTPGFQVVTAAALDGKPLAESSRILIIHQSDVLNRGIRFASADRKQVENWGEPRAGLLIRRAAATAELSLDRPDACRVEALAPDGSVKGTVTAQTGKSFLRFPLNTAQLGGTMLYLVSRHP